MEYGLRPCESVRTYFFSCLNPCFNGIWSATLFILMNELISNCLNPCFNGIWSATTQSDVQKQLDSSLNPCFNGIWSATVITTTEKVDGFVLILVLMEYGLRQHLL